MPFKKFSEKEVRKAILTKINPTIKSKKAKHWSGKIYVDDVYLSTVKIPNSHKKVFGPSKAKNVANQLVISQDQYNKLIECTLSGDDYYEFQSKPEPQVDKSAVKESAEDS